MVFSFELSPPGGFSASSLRLVLATRQTLKTSVSQDVAKETCFGGTVGTIYAQMFHVVGNSRHGDCK